MRHLKFALIIVPLLLTSCLEVKTTTRIRKDGSIERMVSLKGSPETIEETRFNIPREDKALWMISQDSVDSENDRYEARATFESIEALNTSFALNAESPGVQIKSTLLLDEGFFFDRYYYMEKIWSDLPGPEVSMAPYITKAELESLILNEMESDSGSMSKVDTDRLSKQMDAYLEDVIFKDFVIELREGGHRSGHIKAIDEMIKAHADSLQEKLNSTNYYDDNPVWKEILAEYIDTLIINAVELSNEEGFLRFYQDWSFFNDVLVDDYQFSVELPGVIRKTTALDVRGNLMSWEPSPVRLFFGGITLEAESSVIKPWSLIITGILLLITLVVTVAGWMRRPRN